MKWLISNSFDMVNVCWKKFFQQAMVDVCIYRKNRTDITWSNTNIDKNYSFENYEVHSVEFDKLKKDLKAFAKKRVVKVVFKNGTERYQTLQKRSNLINRVVATLGWDDYQNDWKTIRNKANEKNATKSEKELWKSLKNEAIIYFCNFVDEFKILVKRKLMYLAIHFDASVPSCHFGFCNIDLVEKMLLPHLDKKEFYNLKSFERSFNQNWISQHSDFFDKKEPEIHPLMRIALKKSGKYPRNIKEYKKLLEDPEFQKLNKELKDKEKN